MIERFKEIATKTSEPLLVREQLEAGAAI
jgi:hypothetical protein